MCVILYTIINGKKILAKNRDRAYKPKIKLIHELVNGLEVAYIKDEDTGWVEGMDENGFAIVNSSFSRNDGKNFSKKKKSIYRDVYKLTKKHNLFHILTKKNKKSFFKKILHYHKLKNYKPNLFFEGHTLMSVDGEKIYHIENNYKHDFIMNNIKKNTVYSNHGILLKNEGYKKGKKGVSTFLRKKIVETELDELNELQKDGKIPCQTNVYKKVSELLNKNYINLDPRFHAYRDKNLTRKKHPHLSSNDVFINTTSQLLFNITDKEFVFNSDVNNSEEVVYVNKLPKNVVPKIKIVIHETEKNLKPHKIFTKKYIKKVYRKFGYRPNLSH